MEKPARWRSKEWVSVVREGRAAPAARWYGKGETGLAGE